MNGTEKKVEALVDLVEAMVLTQQDMYSKIEFLAKRIKLVEFTCECQDREFEIYRTGGYG